jgi:hypothetical protein
MSQIVTSKIINYINKIFDSHNGVLVGIINALDKVKNMATPKERIAKDSRISTVTPAARQRLV